MSTIRGAATAIHSIGRGILLILIGLVIMTVVSIGMVFSMIAFGFVRLAGWLAAPEAASDDDW